MRNNSPARWAWATTLLWACLVWSLGGDAFASNDTSRILGPLLEWLLPNASEEQLAEWLFAIRKTAHVVEYGVLGVLTLRALWLSAPLPNAAAVALALLFAASLATADEARQASSAERTGSQWDVLLDTSGAALAILGVFAIPKRWRDALFPRSAISQRSR